MSPYTHMTVAPLAQSFEGGEDGFWVSAQAGGRKRFLSARDLRRPLVSALRAALKAAPEASFSPAVRAGLTGHLAQVGRRLAWEAPLLLGSKEDAALLTAVEGALEALREAVENGRASEIPPVMLQFEARLELFGAALESFRPLTNVPLVNEVLILGRSRPPSEAQCAGLAARLPLLYSLVRRIDGRWSDFASLYPKRQGLIARARESVELLQNGVGALALYLEARQSGAQPDDDLAKSGRMLVAALEMMAPLLETRGHLEAERATFSEDLRLDRASKSWQQSGAVTRTQLEELAELLDELGEALGESLGKLFMEPQRGEGVEAEGTRLNRKLTSLRQELRKVWVHPAQDPTHRFLEGLESTRRGLVLFLEESFVEPGDAESIYESRLQELFCAELSGVLLPQEWSRGVEIAAEEAEGIVRAAALKSPTLGAALESGTSRLLDSLEQAVGATASSRAARRAGLSEAYWAAVGALESLQATLEEFSQADLLPSTGTQKK